MSIYLDHAATTPMRESALQALVAAHARVGNPASIHGPGQAARAVLEEARERVAATVGADPIEVIFTSGGTESINLALKGLYWQRNAGVRRPVLLVPDGEHHATIDTVEWLVSHEGAITVPIPLDEHGSISVSALNDALAEHGDAVAAVTAIWANNEVGTIQPVEEISRVCAAAGVPLHLDAVAAYGHADIDLRALRTASNARGNAGPVAISISAHKIGGPIGIGALVLSRQGAVEPLLHGGGQQRQVRSGTQDVPAAVAFAAAAGESERERASEHARLERLRDHLIDGVLTAIPNARLSGLTGEGRLDNNVHIAFPGAQGDSLLFLLDMAGVAVSTGSACQAGIPEPSHVLLAMGRDEAAARSVLRFTLGHTTTAADVDACLGALPAAYASAARAGLSNRAV
ncbi:cysteine desulfurase [Mycetocola tolaasinivorans]|uniref:Cysteine desulfurase n=1 Tax=Mycetocola tolaasinivorans TaxID=76635 RepID=A0A3L7A4M7_9MICO|nr:cysteine desulfurase family protein [Mycetocola tolaasinivorans]RLP75015.1 cysteine desulfurase [Mycetocola tolaasinivorans]